MLLMLLSACGRQSAGISYEDRVALEKRVEGLSSIDSIEALQHHFEENGNKIGSIIALRIKGKRLRDESRFEEAVRAHSEALRQAEALNDTLEWVRILNNIGTDYRRMSILDVAQEYHHRALKLSEEFSDTSKLALKNHVKSLNGLGNIYMSLGNLERADSVLRLALKGEQKLCRRAGYR
ncbi:tetratricopeptide repeat protein [Alloprevotella tannerae]|uniref:tetratricopeptide repeat protein n=1 Tax=Alloprevotella tannerae TaxID=76122 RepID=UPI0028E366AA|nr:tetratricopeptide repeat protein [Alloprevotella tannerae]